MVPSGTHCGTGLKTSELTRVPGVIFGQRVLKMITRISGSHLMYNYGQYGALEEVYPLGRVGKVL